MRLNVLHLRHILHPIRSAKSLYLRVTMSVYRHLAERQFSEPPADTGPSGHIGRRGQLRPAYPGGGCIPEAFEVRVARRARRLLRKVAVPHGRAAEE
jgi:hypothetical protein